MSRAVTLGLVLVAGLFVPACRDQGASPTDDEKAPFLFTDVTTAAGVRFIHENGGTGIRHLPETMGGGAAWFDADGDGDLDLFLVQSGPLPDSDAAGTGRNALYLNRGDGTFEDATDRSGEAASTGYGQGVAAGDVDGDGAIDLYVTNYGPNVLLVNRGDGSFEDRTVAAGLSEDRWGSSAALFDMDNDGDLDLYVVNYLRFDLKDYLTKTDGGAGYVAYAHPDRFRASPDALYRNDGAGVFADVTDAAGIRDIDGKGLGVSPVDLDGDGDLDLYVANDSTPNFVFENLGGGAFADRTGESNAGYNADGRTEAGMGIAIGDVDNDARLDLFVTNLDGETNTLYQNLGGLTFEDVTRARGLGLDSMTFVGFGCAFFDGDLDGDLDLLVGNGHIIDNVEEIDAGGGSTYLQRALLFENGGTGRFRELGPELAPALAVRRTIRALAFADYDDDGDLDVVLVQNNAPAVLLRNDGERKGKPLTIRVVDAEGRSAPYATVAAAAGGKTIVRQSCPAASYCASHDPRVHLATTEPKFDRIEITWRTGEKATLNDVEPDRHLTIRPDGSINED